MSKRKMPKHIVLPNGMWRFVKSGTKTTTKRAKVVRKRKARGGFIMKRRSKGRSAGIGGVKLSRGMIPVSGIVAAALLGAGASTLQEKVLPQFHPLQGVAVGFAVGGVGGAAGAYVRNMLGGGTSSTQIRGNY